jgi:hypothetical protein
VHEQLGLSVIPMRCRKGGIVEDGLTEGGLWCGKCRHDPSAVKISFFTCQVGRYCSVRPAYCRCCSLVPRVGTDTELGSWTLRII